MTLQRRILLGKIYWFRFVSFLSPTKGKNIIFFCEADVYFHVFSAMRCGMDVCFLIQRKF